MIASSLKNKNLYTNRNIEVKGNGEILSLINYFKYFVLFSHLF